MCPHAGKKMSKYGQIGLDPNPLIPYSPLHSPRLLSSLGKDFSMTSLYNDSGLAAESASRLERTLAEQALGSGDYETAWENMNHVLTLISGHPPSHERDSLFVDTSLELAKVCFVLGKGFAELINHLRMALEAAGRLEFLGHPRDSPQLSSE